MASPRTQTPSRTALNMRPRGQCFPNCIRPSRSLPHTAHTTPLSPRHTDSGAWALRTVPLQATLARVDERISRCRPLADAAVAHEIQCTVQFLRKRLASMRGAATSLGLPPLSLIRMPYPHPERARRADVARSGFVERELLLALPHPAHRPQAPSRRSVSQSRQSSRVLTERSRQPPLLQRRAKSAPAPALCGARQLCARDGRHRVNASQQLHNPRARRTLLRARDAAADAPPCRGPDWHHWRPTRGAALLS